MTTATITATCADCTAPVDPTDLDTHLAYPCGDFPLEPRCTTCTEQDQEQHTEGCRGCAREIADAADIR